MNYDFDLLKKHKTSLEEGLYYDAIESLKEDLDPQDIELIDKKENLREKIKTLLSIILDPSEPAKQTKLIFKFKEFLRDNYEWHYECFQQQYDRSNSRNILNIGGVPVLPERNIKRTESLQEVRNGIETLIGSDARFLVLHGPIGCGKSSLATQALYESDILHYFKDGIFWVMVGSDGKDKIRSLQEDLNVRLSDRDLNLSSNSDVALVQLKQRYLETKKDSLIILDDVHSKEVVEYLDVGVKFLITTRDINVIKDKESISLNVKVPDHFKQEESLNMFALSLNVDVENLPKTRINKILKFCKGHPISVAIVSAELADHKEDLKEGSSERWNYYINTLKKNRKNLNEDSDKYMKSAINLAIQSLSPKLKRCFEHFAIFPEDVNLKPEVLATVWDREKTEAENIMAEFRKKSLVVRYWNEALSSYVYGVHDLFLDYLKSNDITSDDRIRSLHKNLLDKYLSPCNWDASKLPKDDNYIFYYLGYHLLLAGMESKFSEIFTNLEFLEAKLQAVEPFDLVLDLKRYKNYISNKRNQFDVAALKEFIEWYGPFVHKGIDIAQLALQEPRNTYIHMEGRKLAEKRMSLNKNLSYIDFPLQHVERREWLPRTINMRDKKVTALCFDSCSNIVIATKGGSLELWNTKCIRLRMFTGHTDDINHLTISSYQLFSCSNDGTVREWKLDQDNNSEDKFDLSPERTQASYHDFWSSAKTGIEACNVLRLPGPVFWVAVYEKFLCSICHNEMPELTIFKNNIEVRRLKIPGLKVCDFSRDGLFIMTGGSEGVHVVDLETFSVRQPISRPVIGISTLLNGSAGGLVTISKDRVDFWGDQTVKMTEGHHFTKPIEEKGANYTCYNTGCQIALVTEKNDILILDSDTGRTLQYISGEHVEKITAIAIKKGMIIVAYSNNKIEIKPINIVDVPISRIFWPLSHAMPVVAKVENSTKLRIVKGHETTELFTSEAAVNNLSMVYTDQCQIVYATNWGDVFIVEGRMGKRRELNSFEFNCPTTVLEMFEFHGHRYVAASTSQDPVKILDTLTNNIRLFDASTKGAHSCNISQNGQVVISTLKSVQVWDFKNVEILTEYKGVRLLAINERVMILSDDSQITVIDINSGETIWTRKEEKCRLVSLSPDGDKLAFISGRKVHVKYLNLIQKTEKMNMYELPRLTSCHSYNSVAVSDGGVVCISTDEPCVFLVSPHHQLVTAAVQISSLVSSSDSFAAIDKLGALHILKPIDYHAINLNRLEISDD